MNVTIPCPDPGTSITVSHSFTGMLLVSLTHDIPSDGRDFHAVSRGPDAMRRAAIDEAQKWDVSPKPVNACGAEPAGAAAWDPLPTPLEVAARKYRDIGEKVEALTIHRNNLIDEADKVSSELRGLAEAHSHAQRHLHETARFGS